MPATINASSSSGIVTTADNSAQLELQTASITRLTIDSSGNVGIGTTAPLSRLNSVASNAAAVTALTLNNSNTGFAADEAVDIDFGVGSSVVAGHGKLRVANTTATSGSNSYMSFYTRASDVLAEKMRIDSSGNVGIGTTTPAGRLDITQATNGSAFVVNALGGSNPNFIVSGSGEQTFRLYNTAPTGSTRTSIKLASRLNTDWEWIILTDGAGTGVNDLFISNLAGTAFSISANRIVSDYKGDLRAAPINAKTSAYVLVATDAGQTISITTGGVTVNASVFSAGDMVSIFNNSGTAQTITQGASVTLRLSGTATTGNRTLAQYGVATLLCVVGGATPTFACTGAGLT